MNHDEPSGNRLPKAPWPLVRPLSLIAVVGCIIAVGLWLLWPKRPLDLEQPSTWPVSEARAIVLARDLGRPCPGNSLWWRLSGTAWTEAGTWQHQSGDGDFAEDDHVILSKAGILCVRSARELGTLHKIGAGAEDAPNSALYLAVSPKQGSCPAAANYETPQYCLSETPLPPTPDIAP